MVWIQRLTDDTDFMFQAPIYDTENKNMLFTIRMHHYGSFLTSNGTVYMPDHITYFYFCDAREFLLKDLHDMSMQLGEDECVRFYYSLTGINDCNHLVLIVTDEDTQKLLNHCSFQRVVDVYVDVVETDDISMSDHDMEELPCLMDMEILDLVEEDSDPFDEEGGDEDDSNFTDDFEDCEFENDDIQFDENIDQDVE
ncbi:hypothetical protein KSP39_PZI001925 [Platanthera zijinensis]|uniref:PB1-like domain-containing protein n=1 Tax=Platanthera zijinensis TaxID=2320716 RepID=A0AAP0C182_9ASPA